MTLIPDQPEVASSFYKQVSHYVLVTLFGATAVFIMISVVTDIVKARSQYSELFSNVIQAGENCSVAVRKLDQRVPLAEFKFDSKALTQTVLPYRRSGSVAYKRQEIGALDVVFASCRVDVSTLDPTKEIFVNWGPFSGEVAFFANGNLTHSGVFSQARSPVSVIARGWKGSDIEIGFAARKATASESVPGPPSLVPIYATQDPNMISWIDRKVMEPVHQAHFLSLGALASVLLVLTVMLAFGAKFPDIRWMAVSLTAKALSIFLDGQREQLDDAFRNVGPILADFSVVALAITVFYFSRHNRWRLVPWLLIVAFIAMQWVAYGWGVRLGWRYAQTFFYACLGLVGLMTYVEACNHPGPRKRIKQLVGLIIASAGFFEAPLEAFARYTAVYYADLIQLSLSWAVAGIIGAESVQNLMRYRMASMARDDEVEKRIRSEQNVEMSLILHGMYNVRNAATVVSQIEVGVSRSQKVTLSGDWMSSQVLKDGSSVVVLGDIFGGGVGAAIAAAAIMGCAKGGGEACSSPEVLLNRLNDSTRVMFSGEVMTSAVLIQMRDDGICTIYNAGHAGVIIARANNSVEFVTSDTAPLGAQSEVQFKGMEFLLHADDRIVVLNSGGAKGARGLRKISKIVAELYEVEGVQGISDEVCRALERMDSTDDHVVACFKRIA